MEAFQHNNECPQLCNCWCNEVEKYTYDDNLGCRGIAMVQNACATSLCLACATASMPRAKHA